MAKRAMTSEKARDVRQQGHEDAKKDVIDLSGDAHSVKSGKGYWQIFLYRPSRIKNDPTFKYFNGVGKIILECLNAFPENRADYEKKKTEYKERLKLPMIDLKNKISNGRIGAFINKAMFNAGEVSYLTIKNENNFYVFWGDDVCNILEQNLTVENSKARNKNQFDCQKVLFKLEGKNIGEIEVRNDSDVHYREIKFRLHKKAILQLLKDKSPKYEKYKDRLFVYGTAIKKFAKRRNG